MNAVSEKMHPALVPLLIVVAAQRFSAYGIRALLILYLVKVLSYSDIEAGHLVGIFTGLLFSLPLLGGYFADRYIGHRKSVILGCVLMTLGQVVLFSMHDSVIAALLLFVAGAGLFEPSIGVMIGSLSPKEGKLKETSFMLFTVAVNFGAMMATLICAWVAIYYSWILSFMISSLGTIVGVAIVSLVRLPQDIEKEKAALDMPDALPKLSVNDKRRIITIFTLSFFSVLYMIGYEQINSSLTIFADRYTDTQLFGYEVPAPYFQVIDPLIVILFGLFFVKFLQRLRNRGSKPAEIMKMAMSLALLSASYLLLVAAMLAYFTEGSEMKLQYIWLVLAVLLSTISQFFLIPIGMTLVSKLAPHGYAGLMMGVWTCSYGIGNYIAGVSVGLMGNAPGELQTYFSALAILCAVASLILLLINRRFQTRINNYVANSG